jgi:DNA-binding NarL/FixJ family response regulator
VDFDDLKVASKALDAILAGEFWFPRAIANGLYLALQRTLLTAPSLEPVHGDGGTAELSPREAAALELLRQGLSNKEIARRLEVSINTVKKHLKNAYDKRGIHSRRQLVG